MALWKLMHLIYMYMHLTYNLPKNAIVRLPILGAKATRVR